MTDPITKQVTVTPLSSGVPTPANQEAQTVEANGRSFSVGSPSILSKLIDVIKAILIRFLSSSSSAKVAPQPLPHASLLEKSDSRLLQQADRAALKTLLKHSSLENLSPKFLKANLSESQIKALETEKSTRKDITSFKLLKKQIEDTNKIPFRELLKNQFGQTALILFAKEQYCSDALNYINAVAAFKEAPAKDRLNIFNMIMDRFVKTGSSEEININAGMRNALLSADPSSDVFDASEREMAKVLSDQLGGNIPIFKQKCAEVEKDHLV